MPAIVIARQRIALQLFSVTAIAAGSAALLWAGDTFAMLVGAVGLVMAIAWLYRPLTMGGRGIWIADGRVFLASRRGFAMDDIAQVRAGTQSYHTGLYEVTWDTVELHGPDRFLASLRTIILKEDRQTVVARLNEAIARHRAAGGPSTAP